MYYFTKTRSGIQKWLRWVWLKAWHEVLISRLKAWLGWRHWLQNHQRGCWWKASTPHHRGLSEVQLTICNNMAADFPRENYPRERKGGREIWGIISDVTCHHSCNILLANTSQPDKCGRGLNKGMDARGQGPLGGSVTPLSVTDTDP